MLRAEHAGALSLLFAGLLFLVESSCAVMRPIPEGAYGTADPAENTTYRVTTNDNRVYDFKKFAVTDSTIVILEVESYRAKPYEMDAIKGSVATPVVIPWDKVTSLERAEHSNLMTAVGIAVGVLLVGSIVSVVVIMKALSGLSRLN
jgi:hypothetical protein